MYRNNVVNNPLLSLYIVGIIGIVFFIYFSYKITVWGGLRFSNQMRYFVYALGVFSFTIVVILLDTDATIHPNVLYRLERNVFEMFDAEYDFIRKNEAFADIYIDPNEVYDRPETDFEGSIFYRRTKGFRGDKILPLNPHYKNGLPNVILITIETFRALDVGIFTSQKKKDSIPNYKSPTPNFDRFCNRGLLFSNFRSSFPTSRSLETILYGMPTFQGSHAISFGTNTLAFEHPTIKLEGLPTMFKKLGYDTIFSNAVDFTFDHWATFFEDRDFDEIYYTKVYEQLAQKYDIEAQPFFWGYHDGMVNAVLAQDLISRHKQRLNGNGRPFFLAHYTMSSHAPWESQPNSYSPPDFSAYSDDYYHVKYLEMLYYADMELGKMVDTLTEAGVMENTILFISGDHGYFIADDTSSATPMAKCQTHVR